MKTICTLISIILLFGFVALTFIMQNNTLTANIENIPALNAVIYSILIGSITFAAGYMFNQGNLEIIKKESTKQIRKAEKAGIDTKENISKIERLNAKIETLETALQEALKNKKN